MRATKSVSKRKWTPVEREILETMDDFIDKSEKREYTPDYVVLEDRKKKNKKTNAKRKTKGCGCK
jgi:hypothetical protein